MSKLVDSVRSYFRRVEVVANTVQSAPPPVDHYAKIDSLLTNVTQKNIETSLMIDSITVKSWQSPRMFEGVVVPGRCACPEVCIREGKCEALRQTGIGCERMLTRARHSVREAVQSGKCR